MAARRGAFSARIRPRWTAPRVHGSLRGKNIVARAGDAREVNCVRDRCPEPVSVMVNTSGTAQCQGAAVGWCARTSSSRQGISNPEVRRPIYRRPPFGHFGRTRTLQWEVTDKAAALAEALNRRCRAR